MLRLVALFVWYSKHFRNKRNKCKTQANHWIIWIDAHLSANKFLILTFHLINRNVYLLHVLICQTDVLFVCNKFKSRFNERFSNLRQEFILSDSLLRRWFNTLILIMIKLSLSQLHSGGWNRSTRSARFKSILGNDSFEESFFFFCSFHFKFWQNSIPLQFCNRNTYSHVIEWKIARS